MPLVADKGRTTTHWAGDKYSRGLNSKLNASKMRECIRIALVNNMPDAALEDTEEQFFELLDSAADGLPVQIKLFSLPNIVRSERAQQHLDEFCVSSTELLKQRFDGVIVTGTEPRQPDLRKEPYWNSLADVLDWAEENSSSTVLSCLAAHAGVLHSDGIGRTPLGEKRFGVFEHRKVSGHLLTHGLTTPVRMPHSRWNEVREEALTAAGYTVLTKSDIAGVDLFVKEKKKSLFVHFQGHPEYVVDTLHKEYRRDVKRYLRRERETYPLVPHEYFDAEATRLLEEFRESAISRRQEGIMETFPEADVTDTLQNSWRSSAGSIYHNWIVYLASRKASARDTAAMAQVANG